ncbi:MAG TPA: S8 family serine peptidase, partial [Actinomycetales bacterium]|nr:S8 family serine peptidase [Actinomycetales bacterium]
MRTTWLGAMVLLLSTVLAGPAAGASDPPDSRSTGAAADRYIVVLKDGADPDRAAARHAREQGANPEKVYRHALRGYAGTMSALAAVRVARDPQVVSVERDQVVRAFEQTVPTGVDRIAAPGTKGDVGSHLTIDGKDDWRVDADVAVIDSGIDDTHPDLDVVAGVDCTIKGRGPFSAPSCADGLPGDGNGHGTHVAGTVAALDNGIGVVGVAPGARLHAVKVLDDSGSGSIAGVVAGIDWVTARADIIDVANMSLGCECTSAALDAA